MPCVSAFARYSCPRLRAALDLTRCSMNFLLGANARMQCSTDPKVVFDALGVGVRALDWILADLECNYFPDGIRRTEEPQLLRGAELAALLDRESGNFQIIW